MTRFEKGKSIVQGILLLALFSYLFYHSFFAAFFLSPLFLLYWKWVKKEYIEQRKWKLLLDFKEAVSALSFAMAAGLSLENAVKEVKNDLQLMGITKGDMIQELINMENQIKMQMRVEELWYSFGQKCKIEEIMSFGEIMIVAKRSGGDLREILYNTAQIIGDKIEMKREIQTMIHAKRLEYNMMSMITLFILMFFSVTSPEMSQVLYGNTLGVIVMTVCLGLYLFAYYLGQKILKIKL